MLLDLDGLGGPVECWGDGRVDDVFAPFPQIPDSESGQRAGLVEIWGPVGVSMESSTWETEGGGGVWRGVE